MAVVNHRDADCIQKGSEGLDRSFALPSTKINIYGSNNSGFKTFQQYKQMHERGGFASVTSFKRCYES